ncbi:MAG: DUF3570 domain-containing protein [Myxococcota bacterium]|nr:DUF3570 domain-containing protein [Myxococcota bacterium]
MHRPKTRLCATRSTLSLFFVASLGSTPALGAGEESQAPASTGSAITTKASTEVSGYIDTDHIAVVSPSIAGGISDEVAGWEISGHYLVDVVSAASVDIVSTASTKWTEIRHAGSAEGSVKVGPLAVGASGVVSSEPDYLSLAGGGTLTVDLLDKNVTPFVGFSYGQDKVGRTDLPREFWRDKQILSGQLGVTFVVDRSTIASIQGDVIAETGYLAKPYRYVPVFTAAQASAIQPGASIAQVNATRLDQRPAEQLPNARHRFALTSRVAHRFEGSTLRLDERAYGDSWGVLASTTDFRFMVDLGRRLTLWPHLRFHGQNQASFWQRAYVATASAGGGPGIPVIRAGDRELSPLYNATGGGGARLKLVDDPRRPWSLVFEIDASYTRYLNALYISNRTSVFSTMAVEAEF